MKKKRSEKQIMQLNYARKMRHDTDKPSCIVVDTLRYCLAILSEGFGETQAKRFLAKINIEAPSTSSFYKSQETLYEIIDEYIKNLLDQIKENLQPNTIFGLDCSWSSRRNAAHAIVVFIDIRTKLIFDFVIISRNPNVSNFDFHSPSNLMETEAVKFKSNEYLANYKFVGFVHDFDLDTAPAFHPDQNCGQIIEYLDPGHLKKVLANLIDSFNDNNHLYQLKQHIVRRFSQIVRNRNLTIEIKVRLWYQILEWIINSCETTGYLTNDGKSRRRVTPEESLKTLNDLLKDSEWLVRKCSIADTQSVESFNSLKSIYSPKRFSFGKSFRNRCELAILHWNDKDYYLKLDNLIKSNPLSQKCQNVIISDVIKKKKKKIISDKKKAISKEILKGKKMLLKI